MVIVVNKEFLWSDTTHLLSLLRICVSVSKWLQLKLYNVSTGMLQRPGSGTMLRRFSWTDDLVMLPVRRVFYWIFRSLALICWKPQTSYWASQGLGVRLVDVLHWLYFHDVSSSWPGDFSKLFVDLGQTWATFTSLTQAKTARKDNGKPSFSQKHFWRSGSVEPLSRGIMKATVKGSRIEVL